MLKLAEGLSLPLDTVTQSMALLARRGAGKTYTGSVLAEEVIKAKVPIVILDPTGAWWGLRSSIDGQHAGLPVVIFGGDHGDVALEPTAGALIAEVVLEHPGAYILDFSAFPSKTAEQTFAASFLEHLYRGKKPDTGALLVVVDEADMFAPQRPGPEQTKTLGALESIVRRGRIKGMGVLLITQRAAVLNKNVLTQTEILLIMQTTGPQDRAALDEWIKGNGTPEERTAVLDSMASMEQGDAWLWSPSFLRILKRVHIRTRTTFDSSKTPGAGATRIEPTTFAQVDLDKLGQRIAATHQQQVANDPRTLKRRIAELERDLARRPEQTTEVVEKIITQIERVEVSVLADEDREMIGRLIEVQTEVRDQLVEALAKTQITPPALARAPSPLVQFPKGIPVAQVVRELVVPLSVSRETNGEVKISKAERVILSALAQYPQGLSRTRLALITGYSEKSGHTKNTLGRLRGIEYITRGEPVQITQAGLDALGPYDPLPTPGSELVQYWLGRLGLAERTILGAFVGVYPQSITKEFLGEATGYSHDSGHFKNTLGRLRGLGLVDGWTASAELMG